MYNLDTKDILRKSKAQIIFITIFLLCSYYYFYTILLLFSYSVHVTQGMEMESTLNFEHDDIFIRNECISVERISEKLKDWFISLIIMADN